MGQPLGALVYSATVQMAGQRQQACPVAACKEDGVTDAARQVSWLHGASRGRCGDDLLMLDVALAVAGGAPILTSGGGALTVAFDVHLYEGNANGFW